MTALLLASSGGSFLYSIVSFIVWLLVMVWIYNIAKRKGRHAVGWLILGFFFSILALIVLALLPSKRTTERY
jgi:predicted Kef-type K+ transport protein